MRTERAILRRIKMWKDNPMLVAGVYRLFTYIRWEKIPDDYKKFFDEKAKEKWDDDLNTYKNKDIALDIKAEMQAILQVLGKKNITHSMGLIPMIMADVYMYGKSTDKIQADILRVIKNYKNYVDVDRTLSEKYAVRAIIDILRYIKRELNLDLPFDFELAISQVLKQYDNKNGGVTPEIDKQIDKALEEYNDRKEDL